MKCRADTPGIFIDFFEYSVIKNNKKRWKLAIDEILFQKFLKKSTETWTIIDRRKFQGKGLC